MNYFYQIRLRGDPENVFDRTVVVQGITCASDKKEALSWIGVNYPEYFEDGKTAQRIPKNSDKLFYVSVHYPFIENTCSCVKNAERLKR